MADFDPYFKWLGIPPEEQPPNHYRLLGIPLFSSDPEVIQNAVDQRMAHLRTMQVGPRGAMAERLLNQVATTQVCLLDPERKAKYDRQLRTSGSSAETPIAPPLVEQFRRASPKAPCASRRRPTTYGTLLKVVLGGICGIVVAAAILRYGFQIAPLSPENKLPEKRIATTESRRPVAPIPRPQSGGRLLHAKETTPPHYFAPEGEKEIRFLDWREHSWEHDIRDRFQVTPVAEGFRISIDSDGYESKLILFPEEDVASRKLCIAFTVEYGDVRLSLRPKDLAPKGVPVIDGWYEPKRRIVVDLWIEDGIAKAKVNGAQVSLHQLPDCFGYFALDMSRRSSIVVHELQFTELDSEGQ